MDIEDIHANIAAKTNPLYFQQCQLDKFKVEFSSDLKLLVQCSLSNDCLLNHQHSSYDAKILYNCLFPSEIIETSTFSCAIKWDTLCSSHDIFYQNSQTKAHIAKSSLSLTALETVIEAITNQSIIPSSFTNSLIVGLIAVVIMKVDSETSFYTNNFRSLIQRIINQSPNQSLSQVHTNQQLKSLELVKSSILSLIKIRPNYISSSTIEEIIHKSIRLPSYQQLSDCRAMSISKCYKSINSIMKKYFSEKILSTTTEALILIYDIIFHCKKEPTASKLYFPVKSIVSMLGLIDDMDIILLQCNENNIKKTCKKSDLELCIDCNDMIKKSKQNPATSQISYLHDEQSDDERDQHVFDLRQKLKRKYDSFKQLNGNDSLSVKDVIKSSCSVNKRNINRKTCYLCMSRKKKVDFTDKSNFLSSCTALPIELVYFRTFLYHVIIQSIILINTTFSNELPYDRIFEQAKMMVLQRPDCPSLRYCCIIIAHNLTYKDGYNSYISSLLRQFRVNGNISSIRVYCEVMISCAVFDDPNDLWKALKDIIVLAINLQNSAQHDNNHKSKSNHIMQSVSYVLMKRFKYLYKNKAMRPEVSSCFHEHVVKCSEVFGDSFQWIHPKLSKEEHCQTIVALQKLGFLSFLDCSFENGDIENHHQTPEVKFDHDVREAYRRLGPRSQASNIFSNDDNATIDSLIKENQMADKTKRTREDSFDKICIHHYINEDIIRYIFSFLGYKLLVRVTGVCKQWYDIANENQFWNHHYQKRFKIVLKKDLIPDITDSRAKTTLLEKEMKEMNVINWRKIFDSKWQKERSLRSRQSSDSVFKVRTCDMLGCLAVLTSKTRKEKHEKMHKNAIKKELEQLKKKEARGLVKKSQGVRKKTNNQDSSTTNVPIPTNVDMNIDSNCTKCKII